MSSRLISRHQYLEICMMFCRTYFFLSLLQFILLEIQKTIRKGHWWSTLNSMILTSKIIVHLIQARWSIWLSLRHVFIISLSYLIPHLTKLNKILLVFFIKGPSLAHFRPKMRFIIILISSKFPQILFIVWSKGSKHFPLADSGLISP